MAASARNTAMATPTRTSNSGSEGGTRVPGGPSGNVDTTVMANSLESTMMRTAWTACSTVEPEVPRAQVRKPFAGHAARHG